MEPVGLPPSVPGISELAVPRRRELAGFALLTIVTLGFYWFYIAYQWAREINWLQGRVKYRPDVVLVATILTCNAFGLVFESLFAFDVVAQARARGIGDRLEQLPLWVIVCNSVGVVVTLVVPFGFLLGFPLGLLGSVLVQAEINKLADALSALPVSEGERSAV